MKNILFIAAFMFPLLLKSQDANSLSKAVQIDSFIKVSRTLCDQKKYDEAFKIVDAAEKISLAKFGKDHLTYANCIFNKGRIFQLSNKLIDAEPYYVKARELRGKILGKEHKDYAAVTNNLAILKRILYKYDEAIALFKEVADIREKLLGKDHIDYASTLLNLGTAYYFALKYDEAEAAFLEVKKIRENKLGKEHSEYARILNNLANLYIDMGRYKAAESLYLETKAIQEKLTGKENADYCWTLNNMGLLYRQMGNFEEAERLFTETNAIRLKLLGRDHADYPSGLMNLGNLYTVLGNYEKARPLYEEAAELSSNLFGKNDPRYGQLINNIAVMYTDMDFNPAAEPLYLEAKKIFEEKSGKESPDYTSTINNLAIFYIHQQKYLNAKGLLDEARTIREKTTGVNHPDYANALEDLSLLNTKMKNLPEALRLRNQAVGFFEKSLGKNHNRYAQNLLSLAQIEGMAGKLKDADTHFAEAAGIQRINVMKSTRFMSERELSSYTELFKQNIDIINSYTFRRASSTVMGQVSYDNALLYKGFLLNSSFKIKNLGRKDKAIAEQFDLLASYNKRLNQANDKPRNERDTLIIKDLEQKSAKLEKDLVLKVAGLGDAIKEVKWDQVKSILKPGEAAIEFIHFKLNFPEKSDSILYAALLVKPESGNPEFIPLFEEKALDSLLSKKGERNELYVEQLYSLDGRGAVAIEKPQKTLYDIIWKPLESKLINTKTIYQSSTGLLHRINLGAIPINEDETLTDKYNFIKLGSTRQLVTGLQDDKMGGSPALFGGITYEPDSTTAPIFNQGSDVLAMRRNEAQIPAAERAERGGSWTFLKWTAKEINAISNIMKSASMAPDMLTGNNAIEESVKKLGSNGPSPNIIHIATHGFFFPDPKEHIPTNGTIETIESKFKISEQPMIRSGIVMAGGNYAWKTGKPYHEGLDDGILTAREISQMNLAQTELVVLSACETGLGDIKGNEGVYGLQRAFKIAGAKYLLMSLWQVPDRETMEFMTTFYSHWLSEKMSIPEAYHQTQKEMKDRFLNPFSWAGFVLIQ